jgi:hypothetical protein
VAVVDLHGLVLASRGPESPRVLDKFDPAEVAAVLQKEEPQSRMRGGHIHVAVPIMTNRSLHGV